MKKEKYVCLDNLDKPGQHKTSSAQFCQVNPKFALWDLSITAGGNIISHSLYTVLKMRQQPGKPNAAQLTWDCGASHPWPKRAKANRLLPVMEVILHHRSSRPTAWHQQVKKQRSLCWKKKSQSRASSRERAGSPAAASSQPGRVGRDALPYPRRGAPVGMLLHCIVSLSASQEVLLGESSCSEPQAQDHPCLTRKGSNYNMLLVKILFIK